MTTNTAPQFGPRISGNVVVYTDLRNGNEDVYDTDLTTMQETRITTSTANQDLYDISGQRIVYTDHGPTIPVVQVYDLSTGTTQPLPAHRRQPGGPGDRRRPSWPTSTRPPASEHRRHLGHRPGHRPDLRRDQDADMESLPGGQRAGDRLRAAPRRAHRSTTSSSTTSPAAPRRWSPAPRPTRPTRPSTGTASSTTPIPAGRTDRDVYIYDLATGVDHPPRPARQPGRPAGLRGRRRLRRRQHRAATT